MEWEFIAPMIISITLILTVGGVMILRPIANRLGDLVEVLQVGRAEDPAVARSLALLTELLEAQNRRLEAMEARQQFTDELLQSGGTNQARIPAPDPSAQRTNTGE